MRKTHVVRTLSGTREVTTTPLQAIRLKCMDCSGWQREEIKNCYVKKCPLHPYRGWWNYGIKKELSPAQVKAYAKSKARLASMHSMLYGKEGP